METAGDPGPEQQTPGFEVELSGEGRALIAAYARMDVSNTKEFKQQLASLFDQDDITGVTIEMTACEHIDTTFIGCVVVGRMKGRRLGKAFTLRGTQPHIRSNLATMGFSGLFEKETDYK